MLANRRLRSQSQSQFIFFKKDKRLNTLGKWTGGDPPGDRGNPRALLIGQMDCAAPGRRGACRMRGAWPLTAEQQSQSKQGDESGGVVRILS